MWNGVEPNRAWGLPREPVLLLAESGAKAWHGGSMQRSTHEGIPRTGDRTERSNDTGQRSTTAGRRTIVAGDQNKTGHRLCGEQDLFGYKQGTVVGNQDSTPTYSTTQRHLRLGTLVYRRNAPLILESVSDASFAPGGAHSHGCVISLEKLQAAISGSVTSRSRAYRGHRGSGGWR